MSRDALIERHGVALEQWQWDALDGDTARFKALASEHVVSFVYFAQEKGGEAVKIGVAAKPEKRLATLQTGNPRALIIKQLIAGDVRTEKRLHRVWKDALIRDEWFSEASKILKLAEHIASEQTSALERGYFIERELRLVVDKAIKERRRILA